MRNISINGKYRKEVFGADGPGPIWRDAMNEALRGTPKQTMPMADIPDPAPRKDPKDGGSASGSPTGSPTNARTGGGRTSAPAHPPANAPATAPAGAPANTPPGQDD